MKRILSNERGMALAVAIFALVVVGALVAGAFFAGTQEQRMAENVRRVEQSFGVADAGLAEVINAWNPVTMNQGPTYPQDSVQIAQTTTTNRSGSYGGYVYKLNPNLYLVDVTGADTMSRAGRLGGGSGARQRVGMITRIRTLQINMSASLTTLGNVSLSGNAAVDGYDHTPSGWTDCDPLDTNKAGISTTGTVTTAGNATVDGVPAVSNDPPPTTETFTQYGDVNYDQLAARATITLPAGNYKTAPVVTAGVCDKTVLTNWGDGVTQTSPCASYFPIIHITGDATLNGVQGQGILLVDGSLRVQGSYEFFGITIVRGTFETSGGGTTEAHFWGGVMAQNVDLDLTNLSGKATLNFSKCAITQALQGTGITASLRSRGWVQLF